MLTGRAQSAAGAATAGAYWLAGAFAAAGHAVALAASRGDPGRRRFLGQRLGAWSAGHDARRPWLWVHGASAGEARISVAVARALADAAEAGGRTAPTLVVSALTHSGLALLDREEGIESRAFPVDWSPILRRMVEAGPPVAFVAVETEIWPACLDAMARAGVPVSFVNARISDRSLPRYRRLSPFLAHRLAKVSAVCARDPVSAGRWVELGARPEAVVVTGDIKFDLEAAVPDAEIPQLPEAREGRPILLAASTHEGEEAVALAAFLESRARHPRAALVLAPRHPERAAVVAEEARESGLLVRTFSDPGAGAPADVVVVDRIGLLRPLYREALAAFVGGSLVEGPGGHNLLEPVAASCPFATGPLLSNVEEQAALLRRGDALRIVADFEQLSRFWTEALDEPSSLRGAAFRASRAVEGGRGALARSVGILAATMGSGGRRP